jgi:hypothetical protein
LLLHLAMNLASEIRAKRRGEAGALKQFIKRYFPEIITTLFAIFLYRTALGRADVTHIEYSITGMVLALTAVAMPLVLTADDWLHTRLSELYKLSQPVVVTALGIVLTVQAASGKIQENFPVNRPDSSYIPEDYTRAINYLNARLKPQDDFLSLTNEASWYYFLNRPCPIRFNIIMFASPDFFQREAIADLAAKPPEFVLFRNNHWACKINDRDIEQALPELTRFIRSRYRPDTVIASHEIWRINHGTAGR